MRRWRSVATFLASMVTVGALNLAACNSDTGNQSDNPTGQAPSSGQAMPDSGSSSRPSSPNQP